MPTIRNRYALPEPVAGAELLGAGEFFVVVPRTSITNLITNPSFETNTTGHTASGATLTRTADAQTHGAYGLKIAPNNSAAGEGDTFAVTLTATTQYTFSCDVAGRGGVAYYLALERVFDGKVVARMDFTGLGLWQRIYLIGETLNAGAYRVALRTGIRSGAVFYTDGWMLHVGGRRETYVDGDQRGLSPNFTDYYWSGAPHASTSVRVANSAAGGEIVSLKALGFRLSAILGLGLAGLVNHFSPVVTGGAFYQGTTIADRSFSLVGAISAGSAYELAARRADLINVFKFSRVSPTQPLKLLYAVADDCGLPLGPTMELPCVFNDGLPGQIDNEFQENLALSFQLYLPIVTAANEQGASLSYQASLTTPGRILYRTPAGTWSKIGSGANSQVRKILYNPYDGLVYIAGNFTSFNGVANTAYICAYNPVTGQVTALGTGANGAIFDLAYDNSGHIIAVGQFSSAGGVANTNRIARWSISAGAWQSLSSAFTGTAIHAVLVGPTGTVYVGGQFSNIAGVAAANTAQRTSAGTWSQVGGGYGTANVDIVYDLALGKDTTTLYAAGDDATLTYLAKAALPGGSWAALDNDVNAQGYGALALRDGSILELGTWSLPVAPPSLWNGAALAAVNPARQLNGDTWTAKELADGSILIIGSPNGSPFTTVLNTAGSTLLTLPSTGAVLTNRSAWWPLDLAASDATGYYAAEALPDGTLFVGYGVDTTATAAAVTAVTNAGLAPARPVIKFTGPGTLYQVKNYTTGAALYFSLTLLSGEVATLDLSDPNSVKFTSNFRGDLLGTILPSSNLDLALMPGANNISVFVAGTTDANTAVAMSWRPAYYALDGTLFR